MSDNFTEQDDTVSTSSKYDFSQGCMDTMSPVKDRTVRMPSVPSLPLASAEVELLSSRSVDCESSSSSTEGLEKSYHRDVSYPYVGKAALTVEVTTVSP
ncbi:unnamed protein product [Nippostrongylus brasiliensis]|uniref:RUBCNL n=1 Tax=Nippostrongylus brasiliensis TaxID=27835 RepID=A0A0N4YRP7_NIPBR|nr:unnamed protein product [Nippostrongylus brasiliensis]